MDEPNIPTEVTRDEVIECGRRIAVDLWVKQFVLMFQLAGELHQEELRAAIAAAFDVGAIATRYEQVVNLLNRALSKQEELEGRQLDLEKRIARGETFLESLARRVGRANKWLTSMGVAVKEFVAKGR